MALLDLSDVLLDPYFGDRILVYRRAETVNQYGESTLAITSAAAFAVVTAASGNDLAREADQQTMGKRITVITKYRLRGPSPGNQPDLVLWHGDKFLVTHVDDYTGYGAGWVQAACQSIDFVDQPPTPALGALVFTMPSNSALIGAI